jgi:predicted deacetylase
MPLFSRIGPQFKYQFWKLHLLLKETTYTLDFGKYFVVSFWSHSIREFSVLLEDSLRIISELRTLTCWEKSKNGVVINSLKYVKKVEFSSQKKKVFGIVL